MLSIPPIYLHQGLVPYREKFDVALLISIWSVRHGPRSAAPRMRQEFQRGRTHSDFGSGGATDLVARLIAQGLTSSLGQQVIVDNRPTGIIPGEIVVAAPPDGYTLLFHGSSLWMMPLLQKVPFDPVKDLAPITLASSTPSLVVVHPAVPAKTIKELIALAKAKPGGLNYGSGTSGSSSHLAAELFKYMARVNIVRVPYKGQGPAVLAVLGGEVQMSFATSSSVSGHIKSGKLRALAIGTAKPSALAPGLPTVAESGLPGYESASNAGMFAPAKTSGRLIALLNREIVQALNRPGGEGLAV
jgi:tripartite-type tricarboxylate transporter receptor subunit TctC